MLTYRRPQGAGPALAQAHRPASNHVIPDCHQQCETGLLLASDTDYSWPSDAGPIPSVRCHRHLLQDLCRYGLQETKPLLAQKCAGS